VPPTASQEEIESAFQKTSRACSSGSIPEPFATRIREEVSKAYIVLSDPARRSAYDSQTLSSLEERPESDAFGDNAKDPEMETDPELDFTPSEYLTRGRVPAMIFGSLIVIIALHVLCGIGMGSADYWRFFLRSSIVTCISWGGYFALRLVVVSKGWLPLYIGLCGVAHAAFNWIFLMRNYIQYAYYFRQIAVYIFLFYTVLFSASFIVAAVALEKGSFTENMRNIRKFGQGRFKRPEW
jgi:hypothetical protein